jgi:hypothetical protein
MRPNKIRIADHLILPFGSARKFDIPKITLSAAAANGIYLTADVPCVYIDRAEKRPLTMQDYRVLTDNSHDSKFYRAPVEAGVDYIRKLIEQCMPNDTTIYERTFLGLYFDYLKAFLRDDLSEIGNPFENPLSLFNALLPIPQMQLYVHDPLEDDWSGRLEPSNNFRVDFGFWTGAQLIAVEIDGNEPSGYARDIRRDRLLRRAEVDVIHILNTEIEKHAGGVIYMLLPKEITYDWRQRPAPHEPPFFPF